VEGFQEELQLVLGYRVGGVNRPARFFSFCSLAPLLESFFVV